MEELLVESHPRLIVSAFVTDFQEPLELLPSPTWLQACLSEEADAPLAREEAVRGVIRDLLRVGGYKPTGRGKPASEYLVKAVQAGKLSSINVAVDACNTVSLHSGLPISVIDLDLAVAPAHIGIAPEGASYVFNASGQEIGLGGLLCVFDHEGPCANAVKDSQRTKTHAGTTRTLSVVWGAVGLEERLATATHWYEELLSRAGAKTTAVGLRSAD